MQTDTIAAERCLASLLEMLPVATRNVSLEWFEIFLQLCYLRYTYRHFGSRHLPTWCEGDSLLAGRLDEIASTVRAVADLADDSTSQVATNAHWSTAVKIRSQVQLTSDSRADPHCQNRQAVCAQSGTLAASASPPGSVCAEFQERMSKRGHPAGTVS